MISKLEGHKVLNKRTMTKHRMNQQQQQQQQQQQNLRYRLA